MYKALELSGDGRVAFLDSPKPHVWYRMTANSTIFMDPEVKKADRAYVDAMPAVAGAPLAAPVHIVTCAFARVALLKEVGGWVGACCAVLYVCMYACRRVDACVLIFLLACLLACFIQAARAHRIKNKQTNKQTNKKKQVLAANIEAQSLGAPSHAPPIYLHVCNNGDSAQHAAIEAILQNTTNLAGYRLQTFPDNPGGFARFRMMQAALAEFPIDYFVMIDDDIKLPPRDGLRTLLSHARPREYSSWWGR